MDIGSVTAALLEILNAKVSLLYPVSSSPDLRSRFQHQQHSYKKKNLVFPNDIIQMCTYGLETIKPLT